MSCFVVFVTSVHLDFNTGRLNRSQSAYSLIYMIATHRKEIRAPGTLRSVVSSRLFCRSMCYESQGNVRTSRLIAGPTALYSEVPITFNVDPSIKLYRSPLSTF